MILKSCEIWFAKLGRPSAKYNRDNPTYELQIRTKDKDQKNEWVAAGLNVKAQLPDEGEPYFRVNLRKRSIKKDGEDAPPPIVVDAKLRPMSPNSIGNGSVGNVRIFQYPFNNGQSIASILMGVQITHLIEYTPLQRHDDFEELEDETEITGFEEVE